MPELQLLTPETIATVGGMILALRIWVEYTKESVDKLTKGRLPTFWYATLVAWVLVYGVAGFTGTLTPFWAFVHFFNGPILAVMAGILAKKSKAPANTTPTNQGASQ